MFEAVPVRQPLQTSGGATHIAKRPANTWSDIGNIREDACLVYVLFVTSDYHGAILN